MLNSFQVLPGRVEAETKDEAIKLIAEIAEKKGLKLMGRINPYPCRVQCLPGTWWEYYIIVKEQQHEQGHISGPSDPRS